MKNKIISIPVFTYTDVFACFPKIHFLHFEVKVNDKSFQNKNQSFKDGYNSLSKSAKNKNNKL